MRTVLDIVALRSLIAVADYGGFHRAAGALALSQSTVSQHIRRLEKSLGRPVVERDGRKTRFTPMAPDCSKRPSRSSAHTTRPSAGSWGRTRPTRRPSSSAPPSTPPTSSCPF
ncbi:helix-turn-helix domain-containing protein [Streptomyces rhizosphaericus]|uniref:helix-turn-helix domain-containing protein n=1 Tax=Streptomyces rhizosphaericus TaxID=114699 RepID=UPI0036306116